MTRRIVLWTALLASLFAVGWWVGRSSATAPTDVYRNLDVFVEVLQKVKQFYVDPVESQKLVDAAARGMLRELDPYSQLLDERSWGNLKATTQGTFGGIGIVVTMRDNYPTVISPIEGGPAWGLGLRPGDVIVRIEGESSAGLSVEDIVSRLRGEPGTRVRISVRREGETEENDYTIERQIIVTRAVPYAFMVEGHVGYLRLANFSERSGTEVRSAVERLRREGATRLILDLRGNPGGLLDQAVDVVEQFVKPGTLVVYTRGRSKGQDQRYFSGEKQPLLDLPLAVLIDEGSASASEIVAGALQDLDRALILGENSFGKGSVQGVFPLRGRNAAVKLTTALYHTPSGRSIHQKERDHPLTAVALDEEAPSQPAARDTTPRPRFKTASGRTVFGGGGIHPDVVVEADSLPPLARRVETRALSFRFANRWVNQHSRPAGIETSESMWHEYLAFLHAENVEFTADELERERAWLDRGLRRELARRSAGDAAAARVALEGDRAYRRALNELGRARTQRDLFARLPKSTSLAQP